MPAAAASWAFGIARSTISHWRGCAGARTLYDALGLPPAADEPQIKAAYRALARRLHPDINPGDEASAQRLAEVNNAYETLGNAEARAAYDRELARHRSEVRRGYFIFAATTLATFAVTVTAVSFAVRWHLQAAPDASAKGQEQLVAQSRKPVAGAPPRGGGSGAGLALPAAEPKWTTYRDARFDFSLRYPAGVFALDAVQTSANANVRTFVSPDGRASLRIVAAKNTSGITLTGFRSALIRERYAGASFDRTPKRRFWFALSGTRGDEAFMERITFSCDGKSMHGWRMLYPVAERTTYDALAQVVLRNDLRGNAPEARCERAKPKPRARRR